MIASGTCSAAARSGARSSSTAIRFEQSEHAKQHELLASRKLSPVRTAGLRTMKTFAELRRETLSTDSLTRRRDRRNEEHQITKAQAELQVVCAQQLVRYVAYLEACSQLVARGELHPMQHPLASYYTERRRDELLSAQHPATVQHPLTRR